MAQNLSQGDFDLIHEDISSTLFSIDYSGDFDMLIKKFHVSKSDSIVINNFMNKNEINFTKQIDATSHILPFYFMTERPNELQLSVISFTIESVRPGETFNRGLYYLVLTTIVSIENGTPSYKNTKVIADAQGINNWFLEGYKYYLERTSPIFKAYKFTPPPPPLPPTTLK